ncbi:MAG: hypothetical protein ACLQLO_32940 [Mycobacterium sp.]
MTPDEPSAAAHAAIPSTGPCALVFFNTYVWIMAATISGMQLLFAMVFLVSVAAVFVISGTVERVRPMLRSSAVVPADSERLADTPFATMPDPKPDPDGSDPFRPTWIERLNVVFVLATSQLVQISVVAALTGTLYLVLGLIVLTPELLNTISDVDAR